MTEKIYIIRHGFRLNWVSTISCPSPTGLPRDSPLAACGETQAEEVAQYLLSLPESERPTAIFSSPYYRCLQTATPTAKALGLPIYVEHGISEWFAPVIPGTGLHPRPGNAQSLETYFPDVDPRWTNIYYPSRKGESIDELHSRISTLVPAFLNALRERLPSERRKRVVMFSHAATSISLVKAFLGEPDLNIKSGCCSISKLVRKKDVDIGNVLGTYDPVMLVSGAHLKQGSDREWGFGHVEIDKGKVAEIPGVSGTENEKDEPIGLQIALPFVRSGNL